MKSKIKSLIFWAAFFFLLITLMFWGIGLLIVNNILLSNYDDLIYNTFCFLGYLFIVTYLIFTILIILNKLPEKIKRFEKFKYLAFMFLLILIEIIVIVSFLPDLD